MSENLLPCPFCGGRANLVPDDSYGSCQVFCGTPGCEVGVGDSKERLQEIIERWNRRATPPDLAAARARIDRLTHALLAVRECREITAHPDSDERECRIANERLDKTIDAALAAGEKEKQR